MNDQTPRDVALVVNPVAGAGQSRRIGEHVATRLRAAGIAVRPITGSDAEDAVQLTHKAVADGAEAVVAVGGDGMAHLACQVVAATDTPLGLVPTGTGNDWAVTLGVPGDPRAAVEVILAGRVRAVDAVRAGEAWWVNVLCSGFDSAVTERANRMRRPRGRLRYDLAVLAELGVFRPVPFTLTLDGQRHQTEAMLVAVGNGPRYGAGIRIAPDARIDDGVLDVTVIGPVSRLTLLRVFPHAYRGTHVTHPAVTTLRARTVGVDAPGVTAYADGEALGPLPVVSECVPGALRVFAP